MLKALLILFLAIASGTAKAEWILLGTEGNEVSSVYADPSSLSKNGDTVKIWSMIDFKKAVKLSDGKQFLSWKTQNEFDCKSKKYKMLAASMHVSNMGEGEVTNRLDYDSPDWEEVPSDSNGELCMQEWIPA